MDDSDIDSGIEEMRLAPLYHSAFYGLNSVLKQLIGAEAGAKVNTQGRYYGNALQAASFEGHDSTVKILLEARANVNAEGGVYDNALQATAVWRRDSIVKILVESGADDNTQGGYYGNALQAAVAEGYKSIVKILIGAGQCQIDFRFPLLAPALKVILPSPFQR